MLKNCAWSSVLITGSRDVEPDLERITLHSLRGVGLVFDCLEEGGISILREAKASINLLVFVLIKLKFIPGYTSSNFCFRLVGATDLISAPVFSEVFVDQIFCTGLGLFFISCENTLLWSFILYKGKTTWDESPPLVI